MTELDEIFPRGKISQAFELLEIVEEEISEGKRRFPDKESEIHDMFMALKPTTDLFYSWDRDVYRSHCRELIDRVGNGQEKDLPVPTYAEVLCGAMGHFTFNAPGNSGAAICHRLFDLVMPEGAGIITMKNPQWMIDQGEPEENTYNLREGPKEAWPGEIDTYIGQMKRNSRTQVPERLQDYKRSRERTLNDQKMHHSIVEELTLTQGNLF